MLSIKQWHKINKEDALILPGIDGGLIMMPKKQNPTFKNW